MICRCINADSKADVTFSQFGLITHNGKVKRVISVSEEQPETSSPWEVTFNWRPLAKANTIAVEAPSSKTTYYLVCNHSSSVCLISRLCLWMHGHYVQPLSYRPAWLLITRVQYTHYITAFDQLHRLTLGLLA